MTRAPAHKLFSELVLPHLDDAYRLSRWLTGNRADAEDVVQDACMRALAAIDSAGVRNGRPWLLTIVRNTALSWLARNRSTGLKLSGDAPEVDNVADAQPGADETMIAQVDADRLRKAIDDLPLVFRETLVMREFNDLSYREIAGVLDVPVGTVMSRLARARGLLLTSLREDEHD